MQKILLSALIISALLLMVSCGIGVGFAQTHGGTSLNYQVPVKDMKFEGEVSATVKGPSVFCIFPAYKPLMKQAMEKLNAEAGIKNSKKALFNVRADVEDKFYIFWCTRHVTVSGDVYSIINENPPKPIEEQTVIQINETSKTAPSKSRFNTPEERKVFLEPFWNMLKEKSIATLKEKIMESLTDTQPALKQEGFYFLGDAALLEGNPDQAEYYYKKGVEIITPQYQKPDYTGLKFHLQQLGLMMPELKESIQSIYNKLMK